MLAAESRVLCRIGRSALKEQAETDVREMLKLDGSSISQATLTVRGICTSCTAHAALICVFCMVIH